MKAANLLSQADNPKNLYLVDFGLAVKYMKVTDSQKAGISIFLMSLFFKGEENAHKEEKPDPRKAHDGTIEYLSRWIVVIFLKSIKLFLGMPILVAQRGEVTWRISPLILSTGV